ncbi:hypothetical protein OC834_002169 [Tilletia horrida]|uniref:ER membrane protein SH3 n=1 Tax=Tilletia horrida TaxID=155126 RepID=A0AAN6JUF1_9BASI|nr:hypothetical protein OC834_002169 [Tilletia horrida]KAK0541152.1 hypothetical protein OC842_000111 [Tilletia horrida]
MGGPATALVIGSTSFLLGTLAMHWTADHLLLWQSPITPTSLERSYTYYSGSLLPVLDSSPHATLLYGAGLLGSTVTLLKALGGRESNWLFDGASLFLYGSVGIVYYNNILINLRSLPSAWPNAATTPGTPLPSPISGTDRVFLALREIASSHAILAVALVGVILLQSAQYYSERLEERERIEEIDAKIRRRIRKREVAAKEAERLRKALAEHAGASPSPSPSTAAAAAAASTSASASGTAPASASAGNGSAAGASSASSK